jgi:hypothetical protein
MSTTSFARKRRRISGKRIARAPERFVCADVLLAAVSQASKYLYLGTDRIIVLALRWRRVAVTSRLFAVRDSSNWKDFKQPDQQNVIVMVARWSQS